MGRRQIDVPVPALALRRAEAAAALGVSVEVFDIHVRPHVPTARVGGVVVYSVTGLANWLDTNASAITDDLRRAA
ncbi:hypothetical protein FSW04_16210 [Baekduia soli]|uniref:DNA-binding protein n=1 Tax=Baekduia soli TaxID=496014 RepID=A0A5B8U784_9ACTN|nr:hypothetical protein [Baekduia soli]QEC48963.1 hypothetical protein FSW04_16210 [Baekduia soli]